ncbi:hypothetical protein PHYNN_197 [Pantoea phage Phynn]|nr:hypothetical protein PHYNN_197 [Pantoea phage Phynn]
MQKFSQVAEREGQATKVDIFISTCLVSVTVMHSAHFVTGSYAQHKAFEEFYTAMPALVDRFAETHIGITGSYKPVIKFDASIDTVEYLRRMVAQGDEIYPALDSSLKSIMDEIKSLCFQTIYKLTKLS